MPKFSVVIPLYNKEKDIQKTLDSLLCQTFTNFEAIVVNDGSTDKSAEIVQSIKDKRINFYNKKNKGVSSARNFGVEKASSENILFLDADDYWYPYHLENMQTILKKFPNAKWFATAYEKQYSKKITKPMISPFLNKDVNWVGVIDNYFKQSYVDALAWTSAVGMKKTFFESLNGFNPNFNFGEDTDLWIRATLKSPIAFSNKISAIHILNSSNRLNHTALHSRNFINIDAFENIAQNNSELKKYLDLNRYSLAIQYKLDGNIKAFQKNYTKIDLENLNWKQQFLLKQNKKGLKCLQKIQSNLNKLGFRLSSF